jgi:hypothetical protein
MLKNDTEWIKIVQIVCSFILKSLKKVCTRTRDLTEVRRHIHVLLNKRSIDEGYTQKIARAINLSPEEHHSCHVSRTQKFYVKDDH